MIRAPLSDFWQVGVVPATLQETIAPHWLETVRESIAWLPDPGRWCYLADPFGVRRGEATQVFVEAYDYRTKHAVIERHELGPGLAWRGKAVVLAQPFHLSYPFLVEDGGEVFMIPESHQANEIALYRARKFPDDWVRETALLSEVAGAEPSLIRHEGRWWMFFTVVGPHARDQRELHVAYADRLTGPWRRHPQNPIVDDRSGGRPGGTPFVGADGVVWLPVQDCSATYGGCVRLLRCQRLTPERIVVERTAVALTGAMASATHASGCHTLSACGEYTLIDTKRIERSWGRAAVDLRRRLRRWTGRGRAA